MYTLRRISGDGVEMNHSLGEQYTVIDRERNREEFEKNLCLYFGFDKGTKDFDFYMKEVYKFVSGQGGAYIQPLFKNQQAYIMTSNGKTFDNLTFK